MTADSGAWCAFRDLLSFLAVTSGGRAAVVATLVWVGVGWGCAPRREPPVSAEADARSGASTDTAAVQAQLAQHVAQAREALVADAYGRAQAIAESGIALAKARDQWDTLVALELRSIVARIEIASVRTEGLRPTVEETAAWARRLAPRSDTCAETLLVLAKLDEVELQLEQALGHAREALEIRRTASDTRRERIVAALLQVGHLSRLTVGAEAAVPPLREAIALLQTGTRERDLLLAGAYEELGRAYYSQGPANAEGPYREAEQIYRRYPDKVDRTVDMVLSLASVTGETGRYGQAEQLVEGELAAPGLPTSLRLSLLAKLVGVKVALGKRHELQEVFRREHASYRRLVVATKQIVGLEFAPEPEVKPRAETVSNRSEARESKTPGGHISNAAKVVAGMRAGFRNCYNERLAVDPEAAGTVRLSIVVGDIGQVNEVVATTIGLAVDVTDCMMWHAVSHEFAAPERGKAVVNVPVTFVRNK